MIWQLMKRDPAWRWMPYFVLASAALSVVGSFLVTTTGIQVRAAFAGALYGLLFTAGSAATIQQGDTPFQATLPVTVRHVYLTRVLSMIGAIWFPVAVSAVIALVLPNPASPVKTVLSSMPVFTLAMVALQSAGIRGFKIQLMLLFCLVIGWNTLIDLVDMPALLPLVCWVAVAGIFLRTWQTVPKSFQSAPLKLSAAARPRGTTYSSRKPDWMPVLSTIFPWGGLWILAPFAVMLFGDDRFFG